MYLFEMQRSLSMYAKLSIPNLRTKCWKEIIPLARLSSLPRLLATNTFDMYVVFNQKNRCYYLPEKLLVFVLTF